MKFTICILAVLFAVALARPQNDVEILSSDFENIGIDGYKFAYVFAAACTNDRIKNVIATLNLIHLYVIH